MHTNSSKLVGAKIFLRKDVLLFAFEAKILFHFTYFPTSSLPYHACTCSYVAGWVTQYFKFYCNDHSNLSTEIEYLDTILELYIYTHLLMLKNRTTCQNRRNSHFRPIMTIRALISVCFKDLDSGLVRLYIVGV